INTGNIIVAASSTFNLGGSDTTANLGLANINSSAGTVNLTGTVTNTGAILALSSSTGSWNLDDAAIIGGTINGSGGATLNITSNGDILNGVTLGTNMSQ